MATQGDAITISQGKLSVPDHPVIPFIEGDGTGPDMSGRNFYEEVAPFENVAEFRRLVNEFAHGASPADSFKFDCRYEDCVHPIKVLLARIRERLNHDRTKSVLVHIRKAA